MTAATWCRKSKLQWGFVPHGVVNFSNPVSHHKTMHHGSKCRGQRIGTSAKQSLTSNLSQPLPPDFSVQFNTLYLHVLRVPRNKTKQKSNFACSQGQKCLTVTAEWLWTRYTAQVERIESPTALEETLVCVLNCSWDSVVWQEFKDFTTLVSSVDGYKSGDKVFL